MKLVTERLFIRELSVADTDNIHALHSLSLTDEYNTLGFPATKQVTEKLVDDWLSAQTERPRDLYVFCIDRVDTKQFIGLIALNVGPQKYKTAEVWYKIHPDHWGKGFATEALRKLLVFGFNTLRLHRIEAGCAVDNISSARVLEKAGMSKEGRKRKILPIRGEWKDNFFYAILEEDFFA